MSVYLVQATVTRKELYAAWREKREPKTDYKVIKQLPDDAIDYGPLAVAIAESERFKKFIKGGKLNG